MRSNIILAVSIICLLTSCVKENFETEVPTPTPGSEVKFTADLGTTLTKTMYGDEVDTNKDGTNDAVKVHWVDKDLISVYGTTCSVKQAEYSVIGATSDDGYSYAASLTKTGAAGVQWGEEATSDFIAVYPSTNGAISNNDGSVTIPASIDATQYNLFSKKGTVWQGTAFNHEKNTSSMPNAVMYAYTSGAKSGETVNLRFKPVSTVLKFKVASWEAHQDNPDLALDPTGKSIQVTKITLTAPEAVAGDFNMTVTASGVSNVAVVGTASNTITLEPQSPITWVYGQSLEFCIFAIPKSNLSLSKDWKVVISTSDGNKTFSLTPKTGANAELAAGKIHKVNVKNGFKVKDVWIYDQSKWMQSIPRNIYIADLSLPGSWYATDSGYQSGSLEDQFKAGIRAFNIDCRLTLNNKNIGNVNGAQWYEGLSDISRTYRDSDAHVTDGTLVLVCSGQEEGALGTISNVGTTVKSAIQTIGEFASKHTEEYVEVIITVAQKPKTQSGYTYGTVNAKMMYSAICNVLNDPEVKPYLYDFSVKDANGNPKTLPEITLNDVKGKIVVKVNMNTDNSNLSTWNIAAPAMFSEGTMAESADAGRYIKQANFKIMNSPTMFWSNSFNPTTTNSMVFHYHQAQNTTGSSPFPTVDNRKSAIESILSQSYAEYSSNAHNGWYQLGIGGWTDDTTAGKQYIALQLNKYVYNILNSMLTGEASTETGKIYTPAPVGAVLMNFVNDGTEPAEGKSEDDTTDPRYNRRLIRSIIDLNGAYFLNRDDAQPAWPNANLTQAEYSATATVGGDAF